MDLAEWAAIEALAKRRDVDPLRKLLKERGLSSFLIDSLTDHLLGITRRPRHRPTTTFPGIIKYEYETALLLDPAQKKTALQDQLAKRHKVTLKRIEQILYPPKKKSPPST